MTAQPVSIRQPEIGALVAGAMTVLVRPIGRLAALDPGQLLWVREPFHLPKRFAHLRPTAAAAIAECAPVFVADHKAAYFSQHDDVLGRRRNAREMPKVWHRQHLRILTIDRLQLHDVADVDLRTAGWKSRGRWETRWDEDARFSGARASKSNYYDANPQVLRIVFERIGTPLPGFDPARSVTRAGPAPRPSAKAPSMRRFPAPDRTPCPRCETRRDVGCEHFPLTAQIGVP